VELYNLPPEPDLIYAGLMVLVDIFIFFAGYLKLFITYLVALDCITALELTNKL